MTSTPANRTAPDQLGVLSHYEAAVWYPGDDVVTRKAGTGGRQRRPAGSGRDARVPRLPQRGRPGALHRRPGRNQYTGNVGNQLYDPKGEIACNPLPAGTDPRRCLLLRGSGDGVNDVLAVLVRRLHRRARRRPRRERQTPSACSASTTRSLVSTWGSTARRARTTRTTPSPTSRRAGSCRPTSSSSSRAGRRRGGTSPADRSRRIPGDQYVYSQISDVTYKRLTRTITVPAGGGDDVLLDVL